MKKKMEVVKMKVLCACEYSGIVRDAFLKKGHFAISCDLLPCESSMHWVSDANHYQGNVFDILYKGWDLVIAFPPCTYLTNSGIRWFNEERYGDKARERKQLRLEAMEFVKKIWDSNTHVCIENPVGYLSNNWKKPTQIIQPYYFGDAESKRTCLWLKNLPKLEHTKLVEPKIHGYYKSGKKKGKPYYFSDALVSSKDRAKDRSKFWNGVANAMANQWTTNVIEKQKESMVF
tara:strand:+ start:852 stop:1547 length:696 start_codon:yes stop_codon:yes gene_type:complete